MIILNDEKYAMNGSQIYDISTGEIIDPKEIKSVIEKQAVEEFNQRIGAIYDLNMQTDIAIVYRNREYNCVQVKKNFEFNKVFRMELKSIMVSKELSKNARCFIGTLIPFISFPSNAIHIKYKNPTYKDLMDILDMSKPTLINTLKELEKQFIIKRIKRNGQLIIYFNCFLYCAGYCVERDTYQIFKNSIYNPTN